MYLRMHVCMYVCMYVCVYMHVCMYVRIYVCVDVPTCVTHIQKYWCAGMGGPGWPDEGQENTQMRDNNLIAEEEQVGNQIKAATAQIRMLAYQIPGRPV